MSEEHYVEEYPERPELPVRKRRDLPPLEHKVTVLKTVKPRARKATPKPKRRRGYRGATGTAMHIERRRR